MPHAHPSFHQSWLQHRTSSFFIIYHGHYYLSRFVVWRYWGQLLDASITGTRIRLRLETRSAGRNYKVTLSIQLRKLIDPSGWRDVFFCQKSYHKIRIDRARGTKIGAAG